MTLVDTNVLLDVITGDPDWAAWSVNRLDAARLAGPLIINDVIFAEIAVRYDDLGEVERLLTDMQVRHVDLPRQALFLAAKAFQRYRRHGGTRTGVLPDFFIGGHAVARNITLLTRDRRRYETYFPSVTLIAP
ncbi:type II toxin-antitoxin system VapC family toxin [Devosia aurantiaca]|uniref:Type II toxin-antitoxin system VapC family toxin n=1 Tax=Devosia aurantiaca TaxID=2714858 RepID=A0A6M1SC10_9HYPH|nr:type II toxin-antitoxin system VapC family toxin [Devosia aurantiaca]NGP17459.1 type II toxin-antitoxin system VapC family toxin [Devosia aurantiaca]